MSLKRRLLSPQVEHTDLNVWLRADWLPLEMNSSWIAHCALSLSPTSGMAFSRMVSYYKVKSVIDKIFLSCNEKKNRVSVSMLLTKPRNKLLSAMNFSAFPSNFLFTLRKGHTVLFFESYFLYSLEFQFLHQRT